MNPIIADVELTMEMATALSGREAETLEGAYTLVVNSGMMIPQATLSEAVAQMVDAAGVPNWAPGIDDMLAVRKNVRELIDNLTEEPWVVVEGLEPEQLSAALSIWADIPCTMSDAILMARAATGEVVWSRNKDVCDYYAKMMEEVGHINYLYLQGDPENDDPEAAEVSEEIAV